MAVAPRKLSRLRSTHDAEWHDPAQVISGWSDAGRRDPDLLKFRIKGAWWEVLAEHEITLLVTREYEHLVIALSPGPGCGELSAQTYLRLPHPSGLAADRKRGIVSVASTRNPNQLYDLAPVSDLMPRGEVHSTGGRDLAEFRPLIPIRSRIVPGSLYLHDLAIVGGQLYGNAVGENSVVRLHEDGRVERAWWPRCIETLDGPVFTRNHLQLNSIAAGADLNGSFFSASTDRLTYRRPSHRNFPVDRRGVVFDGASRDVIARGLTRPHSARLHEGKVWIDNSGYGELGVVDAGKLEPLIRLPGWTRGLCFHQGVAFVGTSRVIPRFRQFAPGLDVDNSTCGVHAIDVAKGTVLGSLTWPVGNQIFAIEWIPSSLSRGFPFRSDRKASERARVLFYAFDREHMNGRFEH
jgi:uncharacterized protein (TIGR03032 family)